MRIGIIGGGAIGLLFTAYLSQTEHDVTLFVRRDDQRDSILNHGLTLITEKTNHTFPNVKLMTQDLHAFDLVIITVKQHHLKNMMPFLQHIESRTAVLFIQNGMSHIDELDQLHNKHILLGVIEHGATKHSDCSVAHKGMGITKVGVYKGNSNLMKRLSSDRFPFVIQDDWRLMLIEKLLINHAINPLTALYKVTNGELVNNPFFKQAMRHLFDEALSVLKIPDETRLWKKINDICQSTHGNRSSMLQDIEAGRQTEIDAISGYILNQANRLGQTCPLTEFIVVSIKGIEGSMVENRD